MEVVLPQIKMRVAGFWIRLLTDVLDTLLLFVVGMIVTLLFYVPLSRIGTQGIWIGLLVTFLYSGVLQSRIGQGQTVAKKIFGIQVVRYDGSYLGVGRSFLRCGIVALAFYGGWIGTGLANALPFLSAPVIGAAYFVLVAVTIAGLMLLTGLHPLKRGLHDLLTDSIVIRKGTYDADELAALYSAPRARVAFAVWGAVAGLILGGVVMAFVSRSGMPAVVRQMEAASVEISRATGLRNVTMNYRVNRYNGASSSSLVVAGFLPSGERENRGDEISRAVLEVVGARDFGQYDNLDIVFRSGVTIGIASLTKNYREVYRRAGGRFEKVHGASESQVGG